MSALAYWTGFSDTTVNGDELGAAFFSSSAPDSSFDILNGGLVEADHWDGTSVPYWAVQPGAWASGYYYGFDRRDFVYVKQQSAAYTAPVGDGFGLLASLTHSFLLPFDTEVVLFGYQAFCLQQCDQAGITESGETFFLQPHFNGTAFTELTSPLPHTGDRSDFSPDCRMELRFRQIGATGMVKAANWTDADAHDKGRCTFDLFVYGAVSDTDDDPRVIVQTGGFWALALR